MVVYTRAVMFKKDIEDRNNLNPTIKKEKNIPYLVDQHLLDKKNA